MKRAILLLLMHKWGLCKPFHFKETSKFEPWKKKGWCPVVSEAYQSLFYEQERARNNAPSVTDKDSKPKTTDNKSSLYKEKE